MCDTTYHHGTMVPQQGGGGPDEHGTEAMAISVQLAVAMLGLGAAAESEPRKVATSDHSQRAQPFHLSLVRIWKRLLDAPAHLREQRLVLLTGLMDARAVCASLELAVGWDCRRPSPRAYFQAGSTASSHGDGTDQPETASSVGKAAWSLGDELRELLVTSRSLVPSQSTLQ